MNISIGDIREIFDANNSADVLSVLDRKVDNIDDEVALLHELKELVLAFIRQIREIDFHNDADVKLLFDKAKIIETSLESTNMEKLFDTSDELDEQLTSVMVESEPIDASIKLDKFEITKLDSCKFVGKSIYSREHGKGTIELFKAFREQSKWIFDELDALKDYATNETHNIALKTWDFHNVEERDVHGLIFRQDGTSMVGYHIGRFMKSDCPIPDGMDSIVIPEIHLAKAWVQAEPRDSIFYDPNLGPVYEILEQEAAQQDYRLTSWVIMADVFSGPDQNGDYHFAQYSSCRPKKK